MDVDEFNEKLFNGKVAERSRLTEMAISENDLDDCTDRVSTLI